MTVRAFIKPGRSCFVKSSGFLKPRPVPRRTGFEGDQFCENGVCPLKLQAVLSPESAARKAGLR